MAAVTHEYEAVYVGGGRHGGSDAVERGFQWLRECQSLKEGLVVVPVQDSLDISVVASLTTKKLKPNKRYRLGAREFRFVTWRTFPPRDRWDGGPVLALWPDADFLRTLHDERKVEALCVVPQEMADVVTWAQASGATDLLTGTAMSVPSLDPVVEQALLDPTRSETYHNVFVQYEDRDEAIMTLELLRDDGRPLPAPAIESWALAHGWPARAVENFLDLLDEVRQRKRLRIHGRRWMGKEALERWREAAGE